MISISNLVSLIGRLRVNFGVLGKWPRGNNFNRSGAATTQAVTAWRVFFFPGGACDRGAARELVLTTTEAILTTIVVIRQPQKKSTRGTGAAPAVTRRMPE
jgi:hypothetical protein